MNFGASLVFTMSWRREVQGTQAGLGAARAGGARCASVQGARAAQRPPHGAVRRVERVPARIAGATYTGKGDKGHGARPIMNAASRAMLFCAVYLAV